MSLSGALNNALSGLKLNQQAMTVLSQNLSNANTPGYSQEIINQQSLSVAGQGSGVQILGVTRKVDNYLIKTVQTQSSSVQAASVINTYQGRVQTLLGSPGASNSLNSYLSTFTNALQQFSDTPSSSANLSNVVNSGTTLATQVAGLAASIEDLRYQADQDISTAVTTINQQLTTINNLNKAIASASVSGQSTADMLDKRDAAVTVLAQQLNISVSTDQHGVVTITTGNGVALVDGLNHKVTYSPAASVSVFDHNGQLGSMQIETLSDGGLALGGAQTLITGGTSDQVSSSITGGSIGALQQLRDSTLPQMLDELDTMASNLRDAVNAVQNSGTSFPPPNSLTGTRAVTADQTSTWSGAVRIAALNADGTPVTAGYADEPNGQAPMTLDLSDLNTGSGAGNPSMQGIINAINSYFGAPQPKVELGNLNNIQLVSDTDHLPNGIPNSTFNFDFSLQNLSSTNSQFFVTGVSVKNDSGVNVGTTVTTQPTLSLSATNTYQTTANSNLVTINLNSAPATLKAGDTIYLSGPSLSNIDGLSASDLTGFVTVSSVSGNQVTVTVAHNATSNGTVTDGSAGTLMPPVISTAGQTSRSGDTGQAQVTIGSPTSQYYDVTATVSVVQADGSIKNSQITYRVNNADNSMYNQPYSATAVNVGGDATRVLPATSQSTLHAMLVDANGNELAKDSNGNYINDPGYLEIVGTNGARVSIDSLDSKQAGDAQGHPGTGRGFSFFFELNNFFQSNAPTSTGDTLAGSALNLKVEQRLVDDPNLVSAGQLTRGQAPTDSTAPPNYTYRLYAGDNTISTKFAGIANQQQTFAASGQLPTTTITLPEYVSQFLASVSAGASAATNTYNNANSLLQGFTTQAQAVSGVSIDDQLAQTVTFQNAYSATARIVTVVNEMFQDIIQMIG